MNVLTFFEAFQSGISFSINSANIYYIKVNNKKSEKGVKYVKVNKNDTRTKHFRVYIVNLQSISNLFLVFILLILNKCFRTLLIMVARQQWKIPVPENSVTLLTIIYQR